MNAWSHLPNAVHIDRVLASAKANPKDWHHAKDSAWDSFKWDKVWGQAWHRVWGQARDPVWEVVRDKVSGLTKPQVRGSLLALVAYDDCAKYLNMPIDQLEMLYHLTEHPACILLQPSAVVFAKEKELA